MRNQYWTGVAYRGIRRSTSLIIMMGPAPPNCNFKAPRLATSLRHVKTIDIHTQQSARLVRTRTNPITSFPSLMPVQVHHPFPLSKMKVTFSQLVGTLFAALHMTTVSSVEYAVTDMETLFNKMSNEAAYPDGFSAYRGNDIIDYLGGKKTTEKHRTQQLSTTSSPTHFPNQLTSLPTQARTRSFWHR